MSHYSRYDNDPWADIEAAENNRLEADMAMIEMDAVGDAIAAARKTGRCAHQSAVQKMPGVKRPETAGLKIGQSRCNEGGNGGCGAVFASDEDWYAAMNDAVGC